jgi:nucleoside recognition membrane protein YjiH
MSDLRHDLGGDAHIVTDEGGPPPPSKASIRKFIFASSLGVLAFLIPFTVDGKWQILIGFLADRTRDFFGKGMPWIVLGLLCLSVIGTGVAFMIGREKLTQYPILRRLFLVSPLWAVVRVIGLVMCTMTIFQLGPEMFWHANTGGTVVHGLAVNIVFIFLFAGFLMPFLTEYGLMEFLGTFLKRSFRRLFTLPGRSAIDALASWMSAAAIGVLITIDQYISGHYTRREAAVIATNFSVVSLPFTLVVAKTVGMGSHFIYFYFVVVIVGVALAIITPRIPPLSLFEDKPYDTFHPDRETKPTGHVSLIKDAVLLGARRAQNAAALSTQLRVSFGHILDIWFGLLPAVIVIGGAGLMLAEYTPLLTWLAVPFVPLIDLLAIPEPSAAGAAMVSGFLDMFLPALLAANLDSEITRFVVGVISVTQLIYMSEIGILLIKCEIPLRFHHLVILFVLRTVIALPIIAAFAHFVVF